MKNTFKLHQLLATSLSLALCAAPYVNAQVSSGGGYGVTQTVVAGGGAASIGGNLELSGTIGQHDAATSRGGAFTLEGGFWPEGSFAAPPPPISAIRWTLVNESCPPANSAVDPGERVSVSLEVMNNGTGSTTNLVGTLQASGNVLAPSGPLDYSAIAPGNMAARTFSFTANGTCGETITLSLQLHDGTTNLGTATYSLTVGPVCNNSCQIARLVTTSVALSCVGGFVQADITLQNQGSVSATGVTLTQAQLRSPAVIGAPVPQAFTLAPGATQNFTVTFATTCPFTGTKLLRLKGTSTNAGSWGSTSGVTSP